MIAVLIVIAGFALIFGAGDFTRKAMRTVAGLIIVLSFLPGLIERLARDAALPSAHRHAGDTTMYVVISSVCLLALVGFVAWRTRAARARRREEERRLHGAPRERDLLPPPQVEEDDR